MSKNGRSNRQQGPQSLVPLMKEEASTLAERIRKEATEHPYRTIGVAAVAGLALSSKVGRTLAGWAGMRMGWDILREALREQDSSAS